MKTLYNYIRDINISTTLTEGSLLDDIDDILDDGDEIVQKKAIVEWIKENDGFVQMFSTYRENDELYKDYNKLKFYSKDQINVNVFRPFYQYAEQQNKHLNLPIPEFIKINNVNNYDFVGNKKDLSLIDFNNLPHINNIDNMLLRCWDGNYGAWVPDLSKLNADEIGLLVVDIEGVHPEKWPKTKISCVHLFGNMITSYKEEYLEKVGYNYNLHNLNGLNTNELVIPDFFISEHARLLHFSVKTDTIINKDTYPYEWQNLNLIFNTKSFKKLYAYACASHSGDRRYREIKKVGDEFIVKGRATKVFDKYLYK